MKYITQKSKLPTPCVRHLTGLLVEELERLQNGRTVICAYGAEDSNR